MKSSTLLILSVILLFIVVTSIVTYKNIPLQASMVEPKITKFCVISNAQGNYDNTQVFVNYCRANKADAVIIAGDMAQHWRDTKNIPDDEEIKTVVGMIAGLGVPVYVIPGHMEVKSSYEPVMKELTARYSNIVDMTRVRVVDRGDIRLVSLPGYDIPGEVDVDGYLIGKTEIDHMGELVSGLKSPIILISFRLPLYSNDIAAKVIDELQINFSVGGDVQSSKVEASDDAGGIVLPGVWSRQLHVNVGTANGWVMSNGVRVKGLATMLYFRDDNYAKYEPISLE